MFKEIVGSAVKISSTITISGGGSPDTVVIDIYNEKGTKVVIADSMSLVDGVYEYVYQSSSSTSAKGVYKVVITATAGSYKDISKEEFELEDV